MLLKFKKIHLCLVVRVGFGQGCGGGRFSCRFHSFRFRFRFHFVVQILVAIPSSKMEAVNRFHIPIQRTGRILGQSLLLVNATIFYCVRSLHLMLFLCNFVHLKQHSLGKTALKFPRWFVNNGKTRLDTKVRIPCPGRSRLKVCR